MIEEIKQRAQNKRYEYHYVDTEAWAEPLDVTEDVTYLLDQNKALVEALEWIQKRAAYKHCYTLDYIEKKVNDTLTTYKGENT